MEISSHFTSPHIINGPSKTNLHQRSLECVKRHIKLYASTLNICNLSISHPEASPPHVSRETSLGMLQAALVVSRETALIIIRFGSAVTFSPRACKTALTIQFNLSTDLYSG